MPNTTKPTPTSKPKSKGPTLRIIAIAPNTPSGQQDMSVKVTFTQGTATGQTQVIGTTTYTVYNGTFAFDPDQVTMNQGNKGTITFSMDPSSTNGWSLYEFYVKNPANGSGLDAVAYVGTNKKIAVTDNNLIAGTYNYGIIVLNTAQNWCATFDPTILDQGGGQGAH